VTNPYAQLRKDLGYEFCATASDRNPIVAPPLRRTDCSLISDGAAALVLAAPDVATANKERRVRFRARAHVNDAFPLSRRDPTEFAGARRAWAAAVTEAGVETLDLDFIETHDCFTIAELIQYEAFGRAERGQGTACWRRGPLPQMASAASNLSAAATRVLCSSSAPWSWPNRASISAASSAIGSGKYRS
jgi:acetyl-CoA C-acetyltransferase